ncbi:hypothetical protein ES703_85751 [subsurface metagenome]
MNVACPHQGAILHICSILISLQIKKGAIYVKSRGDPMFN